MNQPKNRVRFVTAASLFDGHDAAINIMRRLIQAQGIEVIHLGHNRSVDEVVREQRQKLNTKSLTAGTMYERRRHTPSAPGPLVDPSPGNTPGPGNG